jgi:hypothetical protein
VNLSSASRPVAHEVDAAADAPSVWLLCRCGGAAGRRKPQGVTLHRTTLRRLDRYRQPDAGGGAAMRTEEREVVAWVGRCARCGRSHLATRRSILPFAPAPADTIVEVVEYSGPGAAKAPGPWDVEID